MSQYIDQEHLNQIQNFLKGMGLTADRESAQHGDDTGRSLTADYMQQSAEISAMQRKLDREAGTE